jgi:CheY-like chemotaxis protein
MWVLPEIPLDENTVYRAQSYWQRGRSAESSIVVDFNTWFVVGSRRSSESSPANSRTITLSSPSRESGVIPTFGSLESRKLGPARRGKHLPKLRVIVADDNPAFLREITSLLAAEFDVVATATDGNSALGLIRRYAPDLAVLDLSMPGLNGMEVTKELAKSSQRPSVVICSVVTDPEIVEAARQAGAFGYVFKTRIKQDLILALKLAFQGDPFASALS